MRVMVFSPHPDDDWIGCGGSMAKHKKDGSEITIVYMTSGDAGSLNYSKEDLAAIREKEARAASEVLGTKDMLFLRNPDGYLEYNRANLINLINLIRAKEPEVVYIPHKDDAHKDHKVTNELVMEAIGRASGPWFQECEGKPWSVGKVLAYEVWTPLTNFSYVEDISDFIDIKVAALGKHESQIADIRYDEAVKSLNRYRGVMSGKGKYCEVFQVLKVDKLF
jgi:N-acetylglucosamine malate deacetylase 1